jgi:hypothetical protein
MRYQPCVGALALALGLSSVAAADEAEILSHYDAYEAAMAQLRYDVADTEAEAAWRAAEAEWGGVEDTAVLAFNVVRLRLMGDYRAQAEEPARRLAELGRSGNAQSVLPEEIALFTSLAEYDGLEASRGEANDLERALRAYAPTDYIGKRIALLGWSYAANSRFQGGQFYDAFEDAQRAGAISDEDPTAPLALKTTVALITARAGFQTNNVEEGILGARKGIAAYPVQQAGQPLDPVLANLLVWEQGLQGLHFGERRQFYTPSDPALADPVWDDSRYVAQSCMPTWAEPPAPGGGFGGPRPEGIGALIEYRIGADGSVSDVVTLGATSHPFADALREARAEPPENPACQGLYHQVVAFLPPR